LGSLWTPEVAAAWEHAYATCREMMEVPALLFFFFITL